MQLRRIVLLIAISVLVSLRLAGAMEIYLTPAERVDYCVAVFDARVVESTEVATWTDRTALWRAEVEVVEVVKGDPSAIGQGRRVEVYYVKGRNGWTRACPSEVTLHCDELRRLYVTSLCLCPCDQVMLLESGSFVE